MKTKIVLRKTNKALLILCFLISSISLVEGQVTANHYWHEGSVVTKNGEVLTGKLKYDLKLESLLLDQGISTTTYNPRMLTSFSFLDKKSNVEREFISLPFSEKSKNDYKKLSFFEVLQEGRKVTLLLREKESIQQSGGGPYMRHSTYIKVINDYYLLYPTAKIKHFKGTKKDLYLVFKESKKELKKHLKTNRLKVTNKQDLMQIILFYNTLNN